MLLLSYRNIQTEIDNLIEKKKWQITQEAALLEHEKAY